MTSIPIVIFDNIYVSYLEKSVIDYLRIDSAPSAFSLRLRSNNGMIWLIDISLGSYLRKLTSQRLWIIIFRNTKMMKYLKILGTFYRNICIHYHIPCIFINSSQLTLNNSVLYHLAEAGFFHISFISFKKVVSNAKRFILVIPSVFGRNANVLCTITTTYRFVNLSIISMF